VLTGSLVLTGWLGAGALPGGWTATSGRYSQIVLQQTSRIASRISGVLDSPRGRLSGVLGTRRLTPDELPAIKDEVSAESDRTTEKSSGRGKSSGSGREKSGGERLTERSGRASRQPDASRTSILLCPPL